MKKKNKGKLLENTIMLYILTFSSYFFNFITVPYQTRVLGPEVFGKIGFALAFATYFKLVFDFGFILSGTEEVSKNRDDNNKVSKILIEINIVKSFLILFGVIVLLCLIAFIPLFRSDILLYILYFLYVAIEAFQPDFLYRGMENMKVITIRNVLVKLAFCILLGIFLKDASQYYLIPIFNILGSALSLVLIYFDVYVRMGLKFVKVGFKDIVESFNQSKIFFLSRIASTVYGATNTFILGLIYPVGPTLGYYTSSEKILIAGRGAMSPISDSIYPYMVKNKDFKLIKKILLYLMPIITLGCIIVFIFAKPICLLVFGEEYLNSYIVLRFMIPIIWITLPTYLFGFPTMTPLGLKKEANLSVIIGSIYHLVILSTLFVFKILNLYSVCILTITTEFMVFSIRLIYIFRYKKKEC